MAVKRRGGNKQVMATTDDRVCKCYFMNAIVRSRTSSTKLSISGSNRL